MNCAHCGSPEGDDCWRGPHEPCIYKFPPVPERQKLTEAPKLPALKTQIGGDHYKDMAIQPMTYSMANGLDACQHTIVKYVSRFRQKNGIEDLEKARHCLDLLIEFEKAKA